MIYFSVSGHGLYLSRLRTAVVVCIREWYHVRHQILHVGTLSHSRKCIWRWSNNKVERHPQWWALIILHWICKQLGVCVSDNVHTYKVGCTGHEKGRSGSIWFPLKIRCACYACSWLQCVRQSWKESLKASCLKPFLQKYFCSLAPSINDRLYRKFIQRHTRSTKLFYHASWKLSGSRDGVNYVLLHHATGVSFAGRGDTKTFRLLFSGSYRHFRFDFLGAFSDNAKNANTVLEIADINLYTGTCNVRLMRMWTTKLSRIVVVTYDLCHMLVLTRARACVGHMKLWLCQYANRR